MALGDPMEISFALPLPNYRFAMWEGGYPVGWFPDTGTTPTVDSRSPGPSSHAYAHLSGAVGWEPLRSVLLPGSVPLYEIALQRILRLRSSTPVTCYLYRWNDGGSGIGDWNLEHNSAEASWAESNSAIQTGAGCASATLLFRGQNAWWLDLGEIVLRWTPTSWSGAAYETISAAYDSERLFIGPSDRGTIVRKHSGSRRQQRQADKMKIEVAFPEMTEEDRNRVARYYLGSIGNWDGFPRPVAIRHKTSEIGVGSRPAFIVGFFSEPPAFVPKRGGRTYDCFFVIEEA